MTKVRTFPHSAKRKRERNAWKTPSLHFYLGCCLPFDTYTGTFREFSISLCCPTRANAACAALSADLKTFSHVCTFKYWRTCVEWSGERTSRAISRREGMGCLTSRALLPYTFIIYTRARESPRRKSGGGYASSTLRGGGDVAL